MLQDVRCDAVEMSLAEMCPVICLYGFEWFRGVYERLVGCVRQAAFLHFGLWLPRGRRIVHRLVCWLSPHKFLWFAVRSELRRGTVGETVEFEETEIGEPDEKVAVYR